MKRIRYRRYSNNKLESWMQLKCFSCGQFLNKDLCPSGDDVYYCSKCAEEKKKEVSMYSKDTHCVDCGRVITDRSKRCLVHSAKVNDNLKGMRIKVLEGRIE